MCSSMRANLCYVLFYLEFVLNRAGALGQDMDAIPLWTGLARNELEETLRRVAQPTGTCEHHLHAESLSSCVVATFHVAESAAQCCKPCVFGFGFRFGVPP